MLSDRRTFREGLVVGLVAYAAVALFYSAFDFLAARGPLFTVDMLGRAVFRGLRDPAVLLFPQEVDPPAVFWYNGLHLALSLVVGAIVTTLVGIAERRPQRAPAILLAFLTGGVVTVATVASLTEAMRPVLPWWSIVVANLLAATVAGLYLLTRHPSLWRHVGDGRLLGYRRPRTRDLVRPRLTGAGSRAAAGQFDITLGTFLCCSMALNAATSPAITRSNSPFTARTCVRSSSATCF